MSVVVGLLSGLAIAGPPRLEVREVVPGVDGGVVPHVLRTTTTVLRQMPEQAEAVALTTRSGVQGSVRALINTEGVVLVTGGGPAEVFVPNQPVLSLKEASVLKPQLSKSALVFVQPKAQARGCELRVGTWGGGRWRDAVLVSLETISVCEPLAPSPVVELEGRLFFTVGYRTLPRAAGTKLQIDVGPARTMIVDLKSLREVAADELPPGYFAMHADVLSAFLSK